MKSPGILDGLIFAFLVSLGAGAVNLVLGGFVAKATLFNLILLGATLAYLVYLLRRNNARVGRLMVIGCWALLGLGCWLLRVPLFEQVLLQAGFIWLVRALYFHASPFSALLDFGLVSAGLATGAWAIVNTGSIAAALWSFFLVQALFSWIPGLARMQSGETASTGSSRSSFQSAHRVALDAVRKLTQPD